MLRKVDRIVPREPAVDELVRPFEWIIVDPEMARRRVRKAGMLEQRNMAKAQFPRSLDQQIAKRLQ